MNLIVTYAADHVAIFAAKGTDVTQLALINTGTETPTPSDLAALGLRLSNEFGWEPAPVEAKPAKETRAEIAAKNREAVPHAVGKRLHNGQPHKNDPPVPLRKAGIVRIVTETPGLTRREIVTRMGLRPDTGRMTRWKHQFDALQFEGKIVGQVERTGKTTNLHYYPASADASAPVEEPAPAPAPLVIDAGESWEDEYPLS